MKTSILDESKKNEKKQMVMGETVFLFGKDINNTQDILCECSDCSCDGDCPDCPSECGCDE